MKKFDGQRGAALPFIAICIAVLMGFAGISTDVGYLQYQYRQQQSAADAAALAGARELVAYGCPSFTNAKTAALYDSSKNGFTNGTNTVTVVPENPPSTGPLANNNCAVRATITSPHPTFFSHLFGLQGTETATATALLTTASTPEAPCMTFLSSNMDANISGPLNSGCGIVMNTDLTQSNITFTGTISAPFIGYYSGNSSQKPSTGGATFTHAVPVPMQGAQIKDPCPGLSGCAYLTKNPPSTSSCTSYTYKSGSSVPAGCYNSFNLKNANVTLDGTYALTGSSNFSGATLASGPDGTTIYYDDTSGGSAPDFSVANAVTLSPPASGNYQNVVYFQSSSIMGDPNFTGANVHLNGVVYAPGSCKAKIGGGGGGTTIVVFGGGTVGGGTTSSFPSPGPKTGTNPGILQEPVLVQ